MWIFVCLLGHEKIAAGVRYRRGVFIGLWKLCVCVYTYTRTCMCVCIPFTARYEWSCVTESECSLPAKLPRILWEASSVCAATVVQW